MFLLLQILSVILVSIAMALSLAHALELPGKLRLTRENYLALQTIYYPGFTIGGISEPTAILATLVLLILTPAYTPAFWQTLTALVALALAHLVFWVVTQPVNKYWLAGETLGETGTRFFAVDKARGAGAPAPDWLMLRDRWEYSHVARAVLTAIAFVALLLAVVR